MGQSKYDKTSAYRSNHFSALYSDAIRKSKKPNRFFQQMNDEYIQETLSTRSKKVEEQPVEIEEYEDYEVEKKESKFKYFLIDLRFFLERHLKMVKIACGVLVVFAMVLFVILERNLHTYKIELFGNNTVSIYEGGMFKETGYKATNFKGAEKTNKVKIKNNINPYKVGEYTVTYSINSIWKRNQITRKVIVLENPLDDIYFTLNGDEEITVKSNTEYNDPGYNIKSDDGKSYDEYVTVENTVNTKKIGDYEVSYLIKINQKQQKLTRLVHVVGDRYTVNYDRTPTQGDVTFSVESNVKNFDYFLVDGNKVTEDSITYTAHDNGNVYFEMYDTEGKKDEINVYVSSVDRTGPTGYCRASLSKRYDETRLEIIAKDDSGIKEYYYGDYSFLDSTYTVKGMNESVGIRVYDNADNYTDMSCLSFYEPIQPDDGNNSVIYRFYGSSMSYWVEQPVWNYVVAHIWVESPTEQFKSAVPSGFPQLEKTGYILEQASVSQGYWEKGMIGSNASGFVSGGTYTHLSSRYPQWKWSSVSPIVIVNGNVLRDFTTFNSLSVGAYTYGLRGDGYLTYYPWTTNIGENVEIAQSIIRDGVKDTFAYAPVLVADGNVTDNLDAARNTRNGIGQIDRNNFIIVTSTTGVTNRVNGISLIDLAWIMKNNGCFIGLNLDGGGSASLVYKNRNTHSYTPIVESGRDIADIIYFVEK